jgi:hypothetical protein
MATTTDFPGFLRNDDDNLTARLTNWLPGLTKDEIPASVRIYWKPTGMLSEEPLDEIAITSVPASVPVVIEDIQGKVAAKLGPQPDGGTIRVKCSKKSMKASPDVDMQRRLVNGGQSDDLNLAMVKGENDRLRAENQELRRQNVELVKANTAGLGSMTMLVAKQSESIATLGTARAAAAAADEWSGITTILGMVTLYYFFPLIKEQMGLGKDASIREVVEAGKRMIAGDKAPPEKPSQRVIPPPGAGRVVDVPPDPGKPSPASPGGAAETSADGTPGAAPADGPTETPEESVESIIARFRQDPAFKRALAVRVGSDAELQQELKTAAIQAALGA